MYRHVLTDYPDKRTRATNGQNNKLNTTMHHFQNTWHISDSGRAAASNKSESNKTTERKNIKKHQGNNKKQKTCTYKKQTPNTKTTNANTTKNQTKDEHIE